MSKIIKDIDGNKCKIYTLEYLMNTELTEEDLYYIFDTASLLYSLIINMFKFAGYIDKDDYTLIEMCKSNERWVYEHYWTKKQHNDFINILAKIYKNIYQYKPMTAKNAAQWFVFQYGLTIKTKREIEKLKK